MSQAELDALLSGMSGGSEPAAAPAPAAPAAPSAPAPAAAAPAASAAAPAPAPYPAQQPGAQPPYYAYPPMGSDPMMLQLMNQMQQTQLQMMEMMKQVKTQEAAKPTPAPSSGGGSIIRPLESAHMYDRAENGEEDKANQEMLMKVPLEVSVEIGRTKRLVKDILEFTQGTLVVLDKMAGEQVDLFVNGQCIAKGDIVVVEDNFGIRITEIVSREINPESL